MHPDKVTVRYTLFKMRHNGAFLCGQCWGLKIPYSFMVVQVKNGKHFLRDYCTGRMSLYYWFKCFIKNSVASHDLQQKAIHITEVHP